MKYQIGDGKFNSKKEVKQYCSLILNYEIIGRPLHEKFAFFMGLIACHESYAEKVGDGVDYFFVGMTPYKTRCFFIKRVDGSDTDFSFLQCLTTVTHERKVKSAMRHAIRDQIRDFKDSVTFDGSVRCAITGDVLTSKNCHADHYPVSFDDLVAGFCEYIGMTIDEIPIESWAFGYNIVPLGLKVKWREYHRFKSRLRLTTAKANLSRPKKSTKKLAHI